MSDELRLSYLAKRLSSGNAEQHERDELLALMAMAVSGLDERIARVHTNLCEHCSLRHRITELETNYKIEHSEENRGGSFFSILKGGKLPWIIVLILSMIIASLLGVDLKGIVK